MPRRGRNRQRGRGRRPTRAMERSPSPSASPEDSSDSEPPIFNRRGRSRRGAANTPARSRGDQSRRGGRQRSTHTRQRSPDNTQVAPARISPGMMNYVQRQNIQFRKKLWEVWGVWARNVGMGASDDSMDWQPEAERVIPVEFRRESEIQRLVVDAWLTGYRRGVMETKLSRPSVFQTTLYTQGQLYSDRRGAVAYEHLPSIENESTQPAQYASPTVGASRTQDPLRPPALM